MLFSSQKALVLLERNGNVNLVLFGFCCLFFTSHIITRHVDIDDDDDNYEVKCKHFNICINYRILLYYYYVDSIDYGYIVFHILAWKPQYT